MASGQPKAGRQSKPHRHRAIMTNRLLHACSMNEYLLAFLLGILEGLTEFLPVSSTAHLRIAQAFLGIDLADGYWKMFSVVIQLGAILCLPIYFRKRIAEFLSTFPRGVRGDRTAFDHPLTLTLLAFVCTAIPSFLLTKVIGENLESLAVMAYSLIIGGVVMWIVDAVYGNRNRPGDVDNIGRGQAIWIGLCQTLAAVFPGTSRSMATISAGEIAGLSRTAALEFSFLLSIPTMAAATGYDFLKAIQNPEGGGHLGALRMDAHEITLLAIGFTVSFLVAWGVVAWFMNWVRSRGFAVFAIYRILFGIAVLVWMSR
jgi:undecaprenyl-diphosphatase